MDVTTAGTRCTGTQRLSVSRQLVMDTVERPGLSIKRSIFSYQWTTETDGERSVWGKLRRFVLMEYHEFQFCLAWCRIVESLRIFSLFMHLHGSRSLSCHVCFVCASFHPHVIHVCLTADWHLDCTRVDPLCLSSLNNKQNNNNNNTNKKTKTRTITKNENEHEHKHENENENNNNKLKGEVRP